MLNGETINWRAFTDNIILIETNKGPVFCTDIVSETGDNEDGKIIRTIRTPEGPKQIIIDMEKIR